MRRVSEDSRRPGENVLRADPMPEADRGAMHIWRRWRYSAMFLAVAIAVSGCTTPERTVARQEAPTADEYRFHAVHDKRQQHYDDVFLAATFSGGGKRAAALAYGALRALRDTTVRRPGPPAKAHPASPLINEFDFVSAVSGGSVTASFWALNGADNLDRFDTQFLQSDMEGSLIAEIVNPVTLLRLPTPAYSRVDILRDYFSEHLLERKTYGDLLSRTNAYGDRPYLVINATDMSTGSLFPFIQLQFDLLCADLTAFSIADAVAASAAYPVVFNANSLKNQRLKNQRFSDAEATSVRSTDCVGDTLVDEVLKSLNEKDRAVASLHDELAQARARKEEIQLALQEANRIKQEDEKNLAAASATLKAKQEALRQASTQVADYREQLQDAERSAAKSSNELGTAKEQERLDHDSRTRAEKEFENLAERHKARLENLRTVREEVSEWLVGIKTDIGELVGVIAGTSKRFIARLMGQSAEAIAAPQKSGPTLRQGSEGLDEAEVAWGELIALVRPRGWSDERGAAAAKVASAGKDGQPLDEVFVPITLDEDDVAGTLATVERGLANIAGHAHRVNSYLHDALSSGDSSKGGAGELQELIGNSNDLQQDIQRLTNKVSRLRHDRATEVGRVEQEKTRQWEADVRETLLQVETGVNGKFADLWGRVVRWRMSGAQEALAKTQLALEKDLHAANQEYEQKKHEYARKEKVAADNLNQLEQNVEDTQAEVKRLEGQLAEAERRRNNLTETVERLTGERARLSEQVEEAKGAVQRQKGRLADAVSAVEKEKRDLLDARTSAEQLRQDLKRIRTLQKEHAAAAEYYRSQIAHYGRKDTDYVHLIDGGAADNLGFTPLLELLDWLFPEASDGDQAEGGYLESRINKVGIVAVDARSAPSREFEVEAAAPNILDTLVATVDAAIDSKSFLLARELERVTGELSASATINDKFIVKVGFDQIPDFHIHSDAGGSAHIHSQRSQEGTETGNERLHRDLKKCRRQFQQIATRWDLPEQYIEALVAIGEALVRDSEEYRRLVAALGGTNSGSGETVADVCSRYRNILPKVS